MSARPPSPRTQRLTALLVFCLSLGALSSVSWWLEQRRSEAQRATILTVAAHFGMPVSTTHSISTAIMGVGFAKNPRALKFSVIERILWAWVLTIPAAGGIAYGLLRLLEAIGWA